MKILFTARGYDKLMSYRDFFLEEDAKLEEAAALAKRKEPAGMLGKMGSWIGLGE